MATVLTTMYPPIMDTYQPSFIKAQPAKVYFSLEHCDSSDIEKIKYLHFSIVRQDTNASAVNIDGEKPSVYIVQFNKNDYDQQSKQYYVNIPPSIVGGTYQTYLYKIQIRGDLCGGESPATLNNDAIAQAVYLNANADLFTEWSSSSLIKPIEQPEITLRNEKIYNGVENLISYQTSFKDNEKISNFEISAYDGNQKIYTTGIIYSETILGNVDLSQASSASVKIVLSYTTTGGYKGTVESTATLTEYEKEDILGGLQIKQDKEIGVNKLICKSSSDDGSAVKIWRASARTDYSKWVLLGEYTLPQLDAGIEDCGIESMIGYKYKVQRYSGTTLYEPIVSNKVCISDFYSVVLSRNGDHLKLGFNVQLTQRNPKRGLTSFETLGGQYPVFTKNGNLKYKTYNISALISFQDDEQHHFINRKQLLGNSVYKKQFKNGQYAVNEDYDWLVEREYRNLVEEWLADGQPKLFRSLPEGNMIVILSNVQLQPEQALGRRIYNFSATITEVADANNQEDLISLGIVKQYE